MILRCKRLPDCRKQGIWDLEASAVQKPGSLENTVFVENTAYRCIANIASIDCIANIGNIASIGCTDCLKCLADIEDIDGKTRFIYTLTVNGPCKILIETLYSFRQNGGRFQGS